MMPYSKPEFLKFLLQKTEIILSAPITARRNIFQSFENMRPSKLGQCFLPASFLSLCPRRRKKRRLIMCKKQKKLLEESAS